MRQLLTEAEGILFIPIFKDKKVISGGKRQAIRVSFWGHAPFELSGLSGCGGEILRAALRSLALLMLVILWFQRRFITGPYQADRGSWRFPG